MESQRILHSMIKFLATKAQGPQFLQGLWGINYGLCWSKKFGRNLWVVILTQKVGYVIK
jgi:hypothetical protein